MPNQSDELIANQILELRRGTIVIAVLSQLSKPQYGYGLLQSIETSGLAIEAGTLYPLLRRFEKQGILKGTWDTSEGRPRKYYLLSQTGEDLRARLLDEWAIMKNSIDHLTTKEGI